MHNVCFRRENCSGKTIKKDNEDSGASIFSVKKILPRGKGQHFLGIAGFFVPKRLCCGKYYVPRGDLMRMTSNIK